MGKCLNCKITVTDNTEVCPLCRCVLEKDGVAKMQYPNIVKKIRKLQLASRIYLLLAIVIEALLVYINLKYDPEYKWSFIVGYLFAIGYITLYYLVYGTRLSYTMDLIIGIIAIFSLLDILDSFLCLAAFVHLVETFQLPHTGLCQARHLRDLVKGKQF